jgi:multiple sugar transport system ATP-binding protein
MKIVLDGLTKEFENKKKNSKVIAVNNVSIDIPSGTLVGLLGPSGCGKSTTLFMLSGLLAPTRGSIVFGDKDVTHLEPQKRGIGLVFQNYALYPHMTVLQNILFPLENIGMPKDERIERAHEVAKVVQIENLLDRKPSELSGGQQQRVAIARALAKAPDVLLLDEPLSNLDARLRLQTREEIKRIQRETQVTTVFVTHDQEEAMSICDVIVVMKLGVVQQVGVPQEIYDDPHNLFVAQFLGTPPINTFAGVIKKGGVTNYNDSYVNGTLTIVPDTLIVAVVDTTREQGQENPVFEIVYEGWRNNETEDVLTSKPVATTSATSESAEGQYEITVSGGEAQNYVFRYINGVLTVIPPSGIAAITSGRPFDIYTVSGRKVRHQVTSLKGLAPGVYIVEGRKVTVRQQR